MQWLFAYTTPGYNLNQCWYWWLFIMAIAHYAIVLQTVPYEAWHAELIMSPNGAFNRVECKTPLKCYWTTDVTENDQWNLTSSWPSFQVNEWPTFCVTYSQFLYFRESNCWWYELMIWNWKHASGEILKTWITSSLMSLGVTA